MYRRCRRQQPVGCMPGLAFAFALGVALTLTCSFRLVVFLLSLFLICVVLYSCC